MAYLEPHIHKIFQNDLLPEETIVWVGQPDPKRLFTSADIFLVPFSLLWGGFAIFFFVSLWGTPVMDVFGLVFAIVGMYFIFGRFLFKILKKKHTYYAVTNNRVLVLTTLVTRSLRAAFIDRIPSINKSVHFGRGTITFGNRRSWTFMYENTGMEFLSWGYGDDVPTFHDIKDVDTVYTLVNELREKKEPEIF